MFLASFPAGPWQANCYLLAVDGRRAVVVDPGVGALEQVERLVAEHGLAVEGVLLTHGHIDHVASAADVGHRFGVPVWLHADDRELLTDPGLGLGGDGGLHPDQVAALARQFGVTLAEPADLRLLVGGERLDVAGATFDAVHAPGHRPGCLLFRLQLAEPPADAPGLTELVFTGDVLFAGTIGRTDLAGGDAAAMNDTLRDVVLALPDTAAVLPGHGPRTTMAAERADNPYLQPSFLG